MAYTRIELRRREETENGRREEAKTVSFYDCSAEIKNLGAKELYEAMRIGLRNTAVFKVRHCRKLSEVKRDLKRFVLSHDGVLYELYAAEYEKGDRRFVLLKANVVT